MVVSVVIATRNRARRLEALLRSLRAQTLHATEFEVIVVDDSSTDETAAVIDRERARGLLKLRWIEHSGGPGPAAVRNTGWPAAQGDLVAFVDDDCEADPGWLAALAAAWDGDPMRLLQGSTTPIESEQADQGLLTYTYDIRQVDLTFPTANMAYPKALLVRLGGFDEWFKRPSGEDTDLAWRAIEAGAEIVFVDEARVRHAVVQLDHVGMLRRAWRWGDAVPVFKRHRELRRRRLIHRIFFNWSHWYLLRLLVALSLPRRRALWALKYWLAYRYFEDRRWAPGHDRPSVKALAFNLIFDTVELTSVTLAALKNRTLVL